MRRNHVPKQRSNRGNPGEGVRNEQEDKREMAERVKQNDMKKN